MERVCLGIGANLGDRVAAMGLARSGLAALPFTTLVAFAEPIETQPVGPIAQDAYLNSAAVIETQLGPFDLLDALADIERAAGRTEVAHRVKWGPRQLDLDILLYGNKVISHDELVVPHPLMHERLFVLEPLASIAPQAVHPILEMTVAALLAHLRAGGGVA